MIMKTKFILSLILSLFFLQATFAAQSSTRPIRKGLAKMIQQSSTYSIDSIKEELMHPIVAPNKVNFRMASIFQYRLDSVSNDFSNYYYTYNQSNQLVSIKIYERSDDGYTYADSVLIEYQYDAQNRIVSVQETNLATNTYYSKILYTYSLNSIVETECNWDEINNLWREQKITSKTFNQENLLSIMAVSSLPYMSDSITLEHTETYTYGADNLLASKIYTQAYSGAQIKSEYEYNASGLVLSETTYSGTDNSFMPTLKNVFEYDEHNNITLEAQGEWYAPENDWYEVGVPAVYVNEYNSNNQLISKTQYDYDLEQYKLIPYCKETFEYACDKNVSKLKYYSFDELYSSPKLEFVLEYDFECLSTVDMSHYDDVMLSELPNVKCNQSRIFLAYGENLLPYFTTDFHYSESNTVKLTNSSIDGCSVYPTVVSESFKVVGKEEVIELSIIDMSGNTVYKSKAMMNNEIQVSALQAGVYIVNIRTENAVYSKRIIKK